MSDSLFVHQLRLEFAEILGDIATIGDIMVFVAIACLESDYGRSRLAKDENNYFGMKSPKTRPTLNFNNGKTFATYSSRRACVIDFTVWLIMNKVFFMHFSNSRFLIDYIVDVCGYCPDADYKEKLIVVYERIKNW